MEYIASPPHSPHGFAASLPKLCRAKYRPRRLRRLNFKLLTIVLVLTGSLGCGRKKNSTVRLNFISCGRVKKKARLLHGGGGEPMILLKQVHQAQEKSDLGMSVVLT